MDGRNDGNVRYALYRHNRSELFAESIRPGNNIFNESGWKSLGTDVLGNDGNFEQVGPWQCELHGLGSLFSSEEGASSSLGVTAEPPPSEVPS